MAVVQMLACDGCGVFSSQSVIEKVIISAFGKRVTVDVCQNCIEPVLKLISNHANGKKTGRPSTISGNNVIADPSQIVKDNPRPRKRVAKRV
jgi:hypothetical protein